MQRFIICYKILSLNKTFMDDIIANLLEITKLLGFLDFLEF